MHELWCEKRVFSRVEAWIDLLRSARFEAGSAQVLIGNQSVKLSRGEVPVSLRYLAERWDWSKNKVDNFLKYLQNNGMIKTGTPKGTQQTVITICNYESYNPIIEEFGTVIGTPSGHHRDTKRTKNNKERKKEDNNSCNSNTEISSRKYKKTRGKKNNEPTWRTDFEVYKTELRAAYLELIQDADFLSKQQRYHPNVDVKLTLEKACINFWATEAGWKHKRKSKSERIDWRQTLTNAISQPQNKVYETRTTKGGNSNSPNDEELMQGIASGYERGIAERRRKSGDQ